MQTEELRKSRLVFVVLPAVNGNCQLDLGDLLQRVCA